MMLLEIFMPIWIRVYSIKAEYTLIENINENVVRVMK